MVLSPLSGARFATSAAAAIACVPASETFELKSARADVIEDIAVLDADIADMRVCNLAPMVVNEATRVLTLSEAAVIEPCGTMRAYMRYAWVIDFISEPSVVVLVSLFMFP